jgi:cobalamin-dependent methionine synthase I
LKNGIAFTGSLVTRFLAGAERVTAVVCSIGSGLEEMISKELEEDPLHALALDGLGNAAVESISQQTCQRIKEKANISGLHTSSPLSPGEPEWPVDVGQPEIFSLLDAGQLGIHLTQGAMMIPSKTVSFIVGIGHEMKKTQQCNLCSMQGRCLYRHE